MPIARGAVDPSRFNAALPLPFELRIDDFRLAMQDVYDFFSDVNTALEQRGLARLDDMMRAANLSGLLSDMLTASVGKHSRTLIVNAHHNGHPDLIRQGIYANNAVAAGTEGVEIKATRKPGGAVDTHGGRDQWMCVFVYEVDNATQPAVNRRPLRFTEVYLAEVTEAHFRKNDRGPLGTRTSTLDRDGIAALRLGWIYRIADPIPRREPRPRGRKQRPATGGDGGEA